VKKILILNGNTKKDNDRLDTYCTNLKEILSKDNEVSVINLKYKEIKDCIGCYACWLKTPGICALKDDQEEILRKYVQSDFVVVVSPIIMGFTSAAVKSVYDRLLPLVHPFLRMDNNKMSHYSRYNKKYSIGLILDNNESEDEGELEVVNSVFRNTVFTKYMNNNMEDIAYEINNI